MKCLSLTQPWATLIAIGAKKIETRSWPTGYRGLLAIHASKGFPKWAKDVVWEAPFADALGLVVRSTGTLAPDGHTLLSLPFGCVIATAQLVACKRIIEPGQTVYRDGMPPPTEPERSFGDYSPGRFAWVLEDVRPLPRPIPAKGALGLWEWECDVADFVAPSIPSAEQEQGASLSEPSSVVSNGGSKGVEQ